LLSPHILRIIGAMHYIYQDPDWPNFIWDSHALLASVAAVRLKQGRLLGKMEGLGIRFQEEAGKENLADDVVNSSAIEGTVFDPEAVRSSVARRMGIATPVDDAASSSGDIEGAVGVMVDATRGYADPLTAERLFGWQASLFPTGRSGMQRVLTGAWRTPEMDPMQVVSGPIGREHIRKKNVHFEAPRANVLPNEVNRFLKWFESAKGPDPVLKAGLAHLWFVTLHPFEDGNGRVSRAIADMALARAEKSGLRFYSVSKQIEVRKREYYDILERTQKGGMDVTPWLSWFIRCLDSAFDGAQATLDGILRRASIWQAVNGALQVNERQKRVVNALLEGGDTTFSTSRYAKLALCSLDTALRDIKQLVGAGVVLPGQAGGRSTTYSLASRSPTIR
jgi:Fic family protein